MQHALELNNYNVDINDRFALKEINLSLDKGEILLLMGPNGSGKSSLLKSVAGLPSYRARSGEVLLFGENITADPPWLRARKGIALFHQTPAYVRIRLAVLLEKIAKKYGTNDDLELIVKTLNMAQLLDREVFCGFSGGEAKRAELSTILLMRPKVMLLDEPDSGIDIDSLKTIASVIEKVAETGVSVLLVSHTGSIAKLLKNVSRIAIMKNGRIAAIDDASKLLDLILNVGYSMF